MQDTYIPTCAHVMGKGRLQTPKLAPAEPRGAILGEECKGALAPGSDGAKSRTGGGASVGAGGRGGARVARRRRGQGSEPAGWGREAAAGTAEVRRGRAGGATGGGRGRSRARSCYPAAGPGQKTPPAAGHAPRAHSPNNAPRRPAAGLAARRPAARPGERGPEVSPRRILPSRRLFLSGKRGRRGELWGSAAIAEQATPVGVPWG